MVLRNNFFIVIWAILVLHGATAQNDINDELRANGTERTSVCEDPNKFPLFGSGSCISQEAYTAIFLASISLAGVSFLTLIGVLTLYCLRNSKSSGSSDRYSKRSSVASSADDLSAASTVDIPSTGRNGNHVTRAIQLEEPNKSQPATNYYDAPDAHTSSAPYTATVPVSKQPTTTTTTTTVVHKQTEVHELASRKPTNPSRSQPSASRPTAAQPTDRRGNRQDDHISSNDNKITSQF